MKPKIKADIIPLLSLAPLGLALAFGGPSVNAQPAGYFTDIKPMPGIANPGLLDVRPIVTADGLTVLFFSDRVLYQATRSSRDQPFGESQPLGPNINHTDDGYHPNPGPALTADGLVLIFPRGPVSANIWDAAKLFEARRTSTSEPFGKATPLPDVIDHYASFTPYLSPDGLLLLYTSIRPDGQGDEDIWVATRPTLNDPFGPPVNFNDFFPGSLVNTRYEENAPWLSADRLVLLFSDLDLRNNTERPGTRGGPDIWISTRPDTDSPFGPPQNLNDFGLGSALNTAQWEGFPCLSSNWPAPGSKLYFTHYSNNGDLDTQFWEADWLPFQFTKVHATADGLQMDFNAETNRIFQLQYKDALSQSDWINLGGPITATGDSASVTDPLPGGNGKRIYRVVAP